MKKLLLFLLAISLVLCFASCGKDKTPDNTEADVPKFNSAELPSWQEYTIIYPDGADTVISDAFVRLSEAIATKYGAPLRINTDFVVPSKPVPEGTLEILVGKTNRQESQNNAANLKAGDYVIKFEGNRLVILGGNADSTADAVDFYIEHLLGEAGLLYPTDDGVVVKGNYVVNTLTIGGVDISEFTLVRGSNMSSTERQLFTYLQSKIAAVCGVEIPAIMYNAGESEYEILFGSTGRAESEFDIPEGTVASRQTDKKLVFFGNGENANGAMMKYFIDEILGKIPAGESYDIQIEGFEGESYSLPTLAQTNLPAVLRDYTGAYDTDFTKSENVFARFILSVNDLPDEITVVEPLEIENYPDSQKVEVYVATDGNDDNPGTIDAPFATIAEAAKKVASYGGGGTVWVRGGIYDTNKARTISASGTIVSPIFIKAYADETPVFKGGKQLNPADFKPIDPNDPVAAKIPEEAKANVVYVNLYDLGWKLEDMGVIDSSGTPKLHIDGVTRDLARYPNSNEANLYFDYVFDTGSVTSRDGSVLYADWIKRVQKGEFNNNPNVKFYTDKYGNKNLDWGWAIRMIDLTPCMWENTGDIWYYGNVFSGWEFGYYNIESFDVKTKKMTSKTGSVYGAMNSSNSPTGYNTYYLFNAIEALDYEGEWFIDRNTGYMYIYMTENFENADIVFSATSKNAIEFNNSSCIVLDGMTVELSGGYGIYTSNSNNIVIERCNVSKTDSTGIIIGTGSTDCAVIYNEVYDIDSSMISLSASAASIKEGTLTRNIAQNNYCHSPRPTKETGISVSGVLSVASHNYLEDCKINISTSSECIVEYNDIAGGSPDVSDAGLIYLNGYYNFGNHIRYNYLHEWNAPGSGVYFDDLSSCNYAYYNIIDTTAATRNKAINFLYCSSGHFNVFYGNLLVGRSSDYIHESTLYFDNAASLGYRFDGLSATYVTNMDTYGKDFYARFPEVTNFLSLMKQHVEERAKPGYVRNELEIYVRSPANNVIKNNIVLGCNDPIYLTILAKKNSVTGEKMQTTDLVENNYTLKNPELVLTDYKNGDFTILPDIINEIKREIPDLYQLTTENMGLTYALN